MIRRAIVCAPKLPEYDRESGSKRVWDWVSFLQSAGWSVTVAAPSCRGGERTAEELRQRGVSVICGLDRRLAESIAYGTFDLAMVAFYYLAETMLPLLREASPRTPIVVDSVDLHFLRLARQAMGERLPRHRHQTLPPQYGNDLLRELNAYALADAVFTVSAKEADLLADLFGRYDGIFAVPDCEDMACSPIPLQDRRGIAFVGNFRHPPNGEALQFLFDSILPLMPDDLLTRHPVQVIGTGLEHWLDTGVQVPPGVELIGWVPSIVPYLHRSRLSVAPLLHGAGTKRKVIQTLMAGTPAVMTSVGAEGLQLTHDEDALIADDAPSFAGATIALLQDDDLWTRLVARGRVAIQQRHGTEHVRQMFLAAIDKVIATERSCEGGAGADLRDPATATSSIFGAYIVATPNPVTAWPTDGVVEIVWDAGPFKSGFVQISVDGGRETLYSHDQRGRQRSDWIRAGHTYRFVLYGGRNEPEEIASVLVRGVTPFSRAPGRDERRG